MLLAWYRCNDNAASTAVEDASGNGNHGTAARNTSLTSVLGKLDNAYSTNGSSDFFTIPWTTTNAVWTFACWVKPASIAAYQRLLFMNGTNHFYCGLQLNNAGKFSPNIGLYGAGSTYRNSNTTLSTTQWWHVAGVIYPATPDILVYVNGELDQGSLENNGPTNTSPVGLDIGRIKYSTAYYYGQQLIDDVRIYNGAIAAWQIKAIYNAGIGSYRYDPWRKEFGGNANRIRRVE